MKQVVVDGDTPFLPEEIITSILNRLPVKSLIRFRCVSKHWKNLLKSPSFIADQLHLSTNQNPRLLFKREGADPLNLFVLDCEMQALDVQKPPSMSNLYRASIIGSCNGLICVRSSSFASVCSSLSLWNPAIREVRCVPGVIYDDAYFGFGFSAITNDYKIVKILVKSGDAIHRVEVYSLKTDSWKEIEFRNLEGVRIFWDNVTANGSIFWYVSKLGSLEGIVSFDIAMEVFALMPLPTLDTNSVVLKLTVHDKKLALLCHTVMGKFESSSIDFWVTEEGMDEFGKKWSWKKIYNSSPHSGVLFPFIIWRNEIASIVYARPELITIAEPKTVISLSSLSATTKPKISTIYTQSRVSYVLDYVESLVPVGYVHNEKPIS